MVRSLSFAPWMVDLRVHSEVESFSDFLKGRALWPRNQEGHTAGDIWTSAQCEHYP